MPIHTWSSRDFARDVAAAKRTAATGPVFITDRGRPAFVLLEIQDRYPLAGLHGLLEVMDAIPGGVDIGFEAPRLQVEFRAADLGYGRLACPPDHLGAAVD